ncbi:hypothetical protein [Streptomyces sp. Act143]|uniref:hypothetical protein n=1 Tax=Streptomyces sp. Act143 TaxID=2200760 RepID=UPI00215A29DF|nr:hypothetical protein [Streptomyces sp. Act143]
MVSGEASLVCHRSRTPGQGPAAGVGAASLGHALVDDYFEAVAARCRPNTLLAAAYELKVLFSVVRR